MDDGEKLDQPDDDQPAVRRRTQIVIDLGNRIVAGAPGYRPGDVLRIDTVMKLIDGSRPLTREVLQVLQNKGLVALKARTGATVEPVENWAQFDPDVIQWRLATSPRFIMRSLTELRQAIEPRAASLAAQRASADICRDLISLAQELKDLGKKEEFDQNTVQGRRCRDTYRMVDASFHRRLLMGSQNELFGALTEPVTQALDFRIRQEWNGPASVVQKDDEPDIDESLLDDTNPDNRKRFPIRPNEIALYLHVGLARSVEQGLPQAAEAFSRAIMAEIHNGQLEHKELLAALGFAMKSIDVRMFPAADRDEFTRIMESLLYKRQEG